jgi:HlyD family secretion protein
MDRVLPKKFWTRSRVFAAIGIAAIGGLLALVWPSISARPTLNVTRERLTISSVTQGAFDEYIVVTGVIYPLKTIRLDAVEGGNVKEKLVQGGDMVQQGQVLLRLDNNRLQMEFLNQETEMYRLINELQNTRLRLRTDKFNLRKTLSELDFQIAQAKDLFERNHQLVSTQVISDQEYQRTKREFERLSGQRTIEVESQQYQEENAQMQIKQLEGTIERTQTNLKMMKSNLENLTVKAPVPGLLSTIDVEVGSRISAGQNIGQIDDVTGFKMRVAIDEHYISRIFPGLTGTFDFNGEKTALEITHIFPEVRNGRFEVDMKFVKGTPSGIKRGQSLPVRLELGKASQATLLPTGGFFSDTGGQWVFMVDTDGKRAVKRNIMLGRKNPQFYEVLDGLVAGDQVITSSYTTYGDKEILVLQ